MLASIDRLYRICCEEPFEIEGFCCAVNDLGHFYVCHHRRETNDLETGEFLSKPVSAKELIEKGLYLHRPAKELILLRVDAHMHLHALVRRYSKACQDALEAAKKDWQNYR